MLKLYVKTQNALALRLRRDDRGVTSVEYALLIALIAVAIVVAVTALAGAINGAFGKATTAINP